MRNLIAVILLCLSCNVFAGYVGTDPSEMHVTIVKNGDVYNFYDVKPTDRQAMQAPVCAERQTIKRSLPNNTYELGCWWKVGELFFAYTVHGGLIRFNTDLVLINDNYIKDRSRLLHY